MHIPSKRIPHPMIKYSEELFYQNWSCLNGFWLQKHLQNKLWNSSHSNILLWIYNLFSIKCKRITDITAFRGNILTRFHFIENICGKYVFKRIFWNRLSQTRKNLYANSFFTFTHSIHIVPLFIWEVLP